MSEFNLNFRTSVTNEPATILQAEQEIAALESANRAMISNIRQGVQIGIFAIQAMGIALDQSITLLVEAVFLSIEVALEIQALQAAGTAGLVLPLGVFLKGATVISMAILIYQLRQKKTESARRTNNIVSALRMASFR